MFSILSPKIYWLLFPRRVVLILRVFVCFLGESNQRVIIGMGLNKKDREANKSNFDMKSFWLENVICQNFMRFLFKKCGYFNSS